MNDVISQISSLKSNSRNRAQLGEYSIGSRVLTPRRTLENRVTQENRNSTNTPAARTARSATDKARKNDRKRDTKMNRTMGLALLKNLA